MSSPSYVVTNGVKAVRFNAGQKTPNGVLLQSFVTKVGQTYVLSFDLGTSAWQTSDEQRLQVTVQGNTVLPSQIASIFAQGTGTWYSPKSFAFVADSSITILRFQDVSPATTNLDLLLDNVRVVEATPTPTATPKISVTVPKKVKAGGTSAFKILTSKINSSQPIVVNYTMSGTAVSGTDYTLSGPTGQAIIPAGSASTTITVNTTTAPSATQKPTATLTILPSAGYRASSTPATIKIIKG